MPNDDLALVREFAATGSEVAFQALVARHLDAVYSAALRRVGGDDALAQDIAQAVFIILARKAGALGPETILAGWLQRTTRHAAADALKRQRRQQLRDHQAYMEANLNPPDPAPSDPAASAVWQQISPHLEAALDRLGETDHNAVVLRFFEDKTFPEIAAALGTSEAAAKMRVARSLEKLKKILSQDGVALSATVLAGAVTANAVHAAPTALAAKVSVLAAKGAATTTTITTLVKGTLKIMAWTKAKMAIVVASGLIMATGISVVVVEKASLIQGKTESEWIKSIKYGMDLNSAQLIKQADLWRSLGPRGIQILVRALKSPTYDHPTRMCVASLLDYLGPDAISAIPDIINQIKIEKNDGVLGCELGFFDNVKLIESRMIEKDKAALFPELLRAIESKDVAVRNNALIALQYYPDQTDTVIPLMIKSLKDSDLRVRVEAVRALIKIDPQNISKSDLVPVLIGCLADIDGAANEAVRALGELHRDANLAVPALIETLQSEKSYLRNNSAAALGKFGGQARLAIPALEKAQKDSDPTVRSLAANALKQINSGSLP